MDVKGQFQVVDSELDIKRQFLQEGNTT
jgi:hypothetical protein